ncbi:MAG: hypothetical protein K6F53_10270 [Lachnospiraceae bacterium]|nr:hypothetical protein [Lachnospiraceae bacterium]
MCKAIQEMIEDGEKRGEKRGERHGEVRGADMLASLLKLLEPGTPEFEKALNATPQVRKRMYKKYNITG